MTRQCTSVKFYSIRRHKKFSLRKKVNKNDYSVTRRNVILKLISRCICIYHKMTDTKIINIPHTSLNSNL